MAIWSRHILPYLLLSLALFSSDFPFGNFAIDVLLWISILYQFNRERNYNKLRYLNREYRIVGIYLIWAIIGCVRGLVVAENYWEYKNWMTSSCIALFPVCVYAFYSPKIIRKTLSLWLRFAIPFYFLFLIFFIEPTQFYFGPIYLLACYMPLINKKGWRILVLLILLFFLTYDIADQRSQFLKALMALYVAIICLLKRFIGNVFLRLNYLSLIVMPLVLLLLGITGVFNVLADTAENQSGKYSSSKKEDTDAADDTRTFIYYEVINSAIKNDYVLMGRTTARGNDTEAFGLAAYEMKSVRDVKNIKEERSMNELCFLNIFTWLGLIGMLLYMGIYIRAAYLGIYKSKSFFVKMAGIVTAFNFAYGWVENCTMFDILNITYWFFISICLSPKFREMNDEEFKKWYQEIFVLNR